MKKLNAFLALVLLSFVASAQTDPKFGIKAGLNLATLNYENNTNTDWRTGFHLGFLSHVHISPAFSLQPEVYYSSQGTKQPYVNDKTMNLDLRYINIPVLAQYNFHNGLRLQSGPQVGFLVGVSDKVDGVEKREYTTSNFNTVDISLPVGLSYLGYSGWGIDARYNIGLTNVSASASSKAKNSVFQVGAFYLLDHTHKIKSAKKK